MTPSSMIDLDELCIFPATSAEEREKVFDVRYEGYGKYYDSRADVIDKYDSAPNVTLLLATDGKGGPLGTMRLLDRSQGEIELDEFLDAENLFSEAVADSCIELTRFAVPHHAWRKKLKISLIKASYLYGKHNGSEALVAWVREDKAHLCRQFLYKSVGPDGSFHHPGIGGEQHNTYKLDLTNVEQRYKEQEHSFYEFLCITEHKNIQVS